ncbi:MAG: T9SS type A sorting domain-containing protein [Bacteroidales bacterium]
MRKALLIIFIILNSFLLFGQSEFAPIGAKWYYNEPSQSGDNPYSNYILLSSEKDTIILGKQCKIVCDSLETRKHYIYSENDSVFFWYNDAFRLIYDFSANVGDTIKLTYKAILYREDNSINDTILEVDVKITDISNIEASGETLKRYYTQIIEHPDFPASVYVYTSSVYTEKIGSEAYLIDTNIEVPTPGPYPIQLRCYVFDSLFYKSDWWMNLDKPCDYSTETLIHEESNSYFNIYPNPCKNNCLLKLPDDRKIQVIEIIDINGNLILRQIVNDGHKDYLSLDCLLTGIYIIKIIDNNKHITNLRFIKL